MLQGFENSVENFTHKSADDNIFYASFTNIEEVNISETQQHTLREQAKLAIKSSIFMAYLNFMIF